MYTRNIENVDVGNSYSRSGRASRVLTRAVLGGSGRSKDSYGSETPKISLSRAGNFGNYYGPDFERIKTEAYEALEELRAMGLLENETATSSYSGADARARIIIADNLIDDGAGIEKVVEDLSACMSRPRLKELSASLGRDVNLAIILLSRLSSYTNLKPADVSHSLRVVRRGRGQRSIIYEGPSKGSERLMLQVVNHDLPDERYVLSLSGSVSAVQGIGMAFAGYFLGNNSKDLKELKPFMKRERVDLSYSIQDGTLIVRDPDDEVIKARSEVPLKVLRRKKVFELLRGVA